MTKHNETAARPKMYLTGRRTCFPLISERTRGPPLLRGPPQCPCGFLEQIFRWCGYLSLKIPRSSRSMYLCVVHRGQALVHFLPAARILFRSG